MLFGRCFISHLIIIICFCLWFCARSTATFHWPIARVRGPAPAACRHDMLTSVREIEAISPVCAKEPLHQTPPALGTCMLTHLLHGTHYVHSCRPRQEVYPLLRRTCTLLYLYTRDMKNKFNRGEPCSSLDPFYVPLYRAVLSKRPAAPCYPSRRISIVHSDEK